VCSSPLDAEEHHTEHREYSLFLDIFSHTHTHTLDIFVLAFYHFLWVEYGPVCDSLVFHKACHGVHFLGHSSGVGVGVLLEPCDLSDVDDGDDTASDVSDFL